MLLLLPPTKSVLRQREVPATVSSFYASLLYTAMLRTSIAAVVLGCFYFCPLDCDASVMVVDCGAVKTGRMLEKYIPAKGCNKVRLHFYFLVEVLLLLLLRAAAAAHNISTEAEVLLFLAALLLLFTHREGCAEKNKIGFCFLFDTSTQSIASSVTGYVLSPRFLLTKSVLTQREVPATVSSFYVSVLYLSLIHI